MGYEQGDYFDKGFSNLEEPKHINTVAPNAIRIAYGRAGADLDYSYPGSGYPENFEFPIKGKMYFESVIKEDVPGITLGACQISLRNESGGAYVLYSSFPERLDGYPHYIGKPDFTISGQQISWDFQNSTFKRDGTQLIVNGISYLTISLTVTLAGDIIASGNFTSDPSQYNHSDPNVSKFYKQIPELAVLYGSVPPSVISVRKNPHLEG